MGASSSIMQRRKGSLEIDEVLRRPLDCSDVTDLESAKRELHFLRGLAQQLVEQQKEQQRQQKQQNHAGQRQQPEQPPSAEQRTSSPEHGGGSAQETRAPEPVGGPKVSLSSGTMLLGAIKTKHEELPPAISHGAHRGAVLEPVESSPQLVPPPGTMLKATRALLLEACNANVLFRTVNATELESIVDVFTSRICEANEIIIRQGETDGKHFYVVEEGSCEVLIQAPGQHRAGESISTGQLLRKGDTFGELALMYSTPRAATIKAKTTMRLWTLDRRHFKAILSKSRKERLQEQVALLSPISIDGSPSLCELLSSDRLSALASAMERETFSRGDVILRQGSRGDFFYVIVSGRVKVYRISEEEGNAQRSAGDGSNFGGEVSELTRGMYFGERALLTSDVRAATCVADSDVALLTMTRQVFTSLIGSLRELQANVANERSGTDAQQGSAEDAQGDGAVCNDEVCSLEELDIHALLGHGAFGVVRLVCNKKTGKKYALKSQSKRAIVSNKLEKRVFNERNVLLSCQHAFVVKLHGAFSTPGCIYFVLELLLGGELFTHLRKRKYLDEQAAQFYLGCVLLALDHIHSRRVAYRDIKPENLVLNEQGYAKIVDFGLAKPLPPGGKTYTLCGTPDYLAPELICNDGHDWAVDYWALGVLCYEICVGVSPFYAKDNLTTYENILEGAVRFPKRMSRPCAELIRKFLRQRPSRRLGYTHGGADAVKQQRWFSSFDWPGLIDFRLQAPIIPQMGSDMDSSNFYSAQASANALEEAARMERTMEEPVNWEPGF